VTRWYATLDHRVTEDVTVAILPQLKHFMNESCSEMLEESAHLVKAGVWKSYHLKGSQ
jgi:hypothetical protein